MKEKRRSILEMLAAVGSITAILAYFISPRWLRHGAHAAHAVERLITAEDDHNERPPKNL